MSNVRSVGPQLGFQVSVRMPDGRVVGLKARERRYRWCYRLSFVDAFAEHTRGLDVARFWGSGKGSTCDAMRAFPAPIRVEATCGDSACRRSHTPKVGESIYFAGNLRRFS